MLGASEELLLVNAASPKQKAAVRFVSFCATHLDPTTQYMLYPDTLRRCPDVMDITEMCRVLDISTKTGYRLLKNGDISSLKIGRAYRIPKAHLLAYLKIRKASGLW